MLAFIGGASWHSADLAIYGVLNRLRPPLPDPRVVLVDVDDYDPDNPVAVRSTLAAFLDHLEAIAGRPYAAALPAAIIFDFEFLAGDPSTVLQRSLVRRQTSLHVFADKNPFKNGKVDATSKPYATELYSTLDGSGHTSFGSDLRSPIAISYDYLCETINADGSWQPLWALPDVVLGATTLVPSTHCERPAAAPIRLGAALSDPSASATTTFVKLDIDATHPFPSTANWLGKFVIVATIEHDAGDVPPYSNPEILAWWLSGLLGSKSGTVPSTPIVLEAAAGATLATGVLFTAIFSLMRRRTLGRLRRHSPLLSAVTAAALALTLIVGVEIVALFALNTLLPQVTVPAFAVILTATLAGVHGRGLMQDELRRHDQIRPPSHDYDVFISYAHNDVAWVKNNVLRVLENVKDSRERALLKIFFDENAIEVSSAWETSISLAIAGSTCFVAVVSEDYFDRGYCAYEFAFAHQQWVRAKLKQGIIFPIIIGKGTIPPEFSLVQRGHDSPATVNDTLRAVIRYALAGRPA